ncbi:MAG: flagellar biosynthetic protein FliO [Acidobacteria bacterium]|nr:flagellar biosynthetic protein FliO [Acidobacteriota bacterium]
MPILDQVLAALFVLALLGGVLWFASRRGLITPRFPGSKRTAPDPIQVVHRVALTPQHCLHVVEAKGAALIVGTFPGGMVFAPEAASFDASLQAAIRRTGGGQQ